MRRKAQSGQIMILVAVSLIALIGSAALVLLAGSVEWQRNQLQQLADQAALDSALRIGIGCSGAQATNVITEADNFIAAQRTRTGVLSVAAGTCATPYTGTDTFAGPVTATINYPYRAHQQQVEVILTEVLPISFGNAFGKTNTTVTRRAVAQQLPGSTTAITAANLSCTGGQFNVAGSIAVSNTVALSGGCAVYAHTRFAAASGTYSDLGNVSVYANGQTWVNGGGVCVAGANAGSSNAVCADGYELSGHNAMTCGTSGTSAFLSAGDALINPNPCAAGKAPQPVAPVAVLLPPEPNTDAAALASLSATPGVPCNPAAVYPNLVVGGATVGTAVGGTPVPTKDASNFYHFKPSCYGYLDFGALPGGGGGGPITRVQNGPEVGGFLTVTPTLPAPSTAGNMLVVTIRMTPTTTASTAPGGWVNAVGINEPNTGRVEIFYLANNPGNISSATFSFNPNFNVGVAQMSEWTGATTLDQIGTKTYSSQVPTATVSTSGATSAANELVITSIGYVPAGGGNNYTPGAGWTSLANDQFFFASEYRLNLPAAVASETVNYDSDTTWSMAIATFKSGGPAPAGAVLDPGFYYFNGSGFAGGGGACLSGTTLLARDVTLEFVNQAGLSTGTCAAGGGGGCASGTCQLGSTPCSISACPPNSAADPSSANGNTWFAAPCSLAPPAVGTQDPSCPGSTWCPAGDRACTNLLIWAPASSTGQIAISGSAAKAWLVGSAFWPGTCTYTVNGTSTWDGTVACGSLNVSAAAGAAVGIGSDYGISTALVEAVLAE